MIPHDLHLLLYNNIRLKKGSRFPKLAQQGQAASTGQNQPANEQAQQQGQAQQQEQLPPDSTQEALKFWLGDSASRFSNLKARTPGEKVIEFPGVANRFRKTMRVNTGLGTYVFRAPQTESKMYNPYPWAGGGTQPTVTGTGGTSSDDLMKMMLLKQMMGKESGQEAILGFLGQMLQLFGPLIEELRQQQQQQKQQAKSQSGTAQQAEQQQQATQQQQPVEQPQKTASFRKLADVPTRLQPVVKNPLWYIPGLTYGLLGAGVGALGYGVAPTFFSSRTQVSPRHLALGALLGAITGASVEIAYRSWNKIFGFGG
jgi:hypothetical protein